MIDPRTATSSPPAPPATASYPLIDSTDLRKLFLDARLRWQAQPPPSEAVAVLDEAWMRLEDSLHRYPALRRQVLADAAGPRAPAPLQAADEDPLPALPAVREAVRLMEEVYLRLPMGGAAGSATHRRSLPWLNRFGRWTGAPLFRRWWPWLVPLHDADFVRFVERELTVPPLADHFGSARALDSSQDYDAYALRRWRDELNRDPVAAAALHPGTEETTVYGFFLRFDPPWGEVNAAVAVVDCLRQGGDRVARWRAEDFYVPPGLWGIGIGEAFLCELLVLLGKRECVRARVESPPTGGAHWHTLYSSQEFIRKIEKVAGGPERTYFEKPLPLERAADR